MKDFVADKKQEYENGPDGDPGTGDDNCASMTQDQVLDLVCCFLQNCAGNVCTGGGVSPEKNMMCDEEQVKKCVQEILLQHFDRDPENDDLTDAEVAKIRGCMCEGGCSCDANGVPEAGQEDTEVVPDPDDPCPDNEGKTDKPVSLFYGDKVETATDLRVAVTGPDLVVTRQYNSNPDFDSEGFTGEQWTFSLARFLAFGDGGCNTGTCNGMIGGQGGFAGRVSVDDANGEWPTTVPTPGPTSQHFKRTSLTLGGTTYPVWRLIESGEWEIDFYRRKVSGESGFDVTLTANQMLEGRILQIRDAYGNARTFSYAQGATGTYTNRPTRIDLIDKGGQLEASVRLFWDLSPNGPNKARLRRIEVARDDSSGKLVATQRVRYTYMDAAVWANAGLGTDRDLIQVLQEERVDPPPGSPTQATWRVRVTQYRYHGGTVNETGTDLDNDGFVHESGSAHQLKMVLLPEQIEYAAQRFNLEHPGDELSPEAFAAELLDMTDGTTVYNEDSIPAGTIPVIVADLAAKVLEEYEGTGDRRLLTQYVQSSCGCGGAATQGLRLRYQYFGPYTVPPPSNRPGRTLKVTEEIVQGSILHRTLYYDTELFGTSPDPSVPYLVNEAVIDGSKQWVTHHEYDPGEHTLSRTMTPAVKVTYTPSTGAAPTYSPNTGAGLVYDYLYTTANDPAVEGEENRLTTTRVRKGSQGPPTPISTITYGVSGQTGERVFLPKKIERFRVANSVAPNDVEVTDFTYGFITTGPPPYTWADIAWIGTQTEAELATENGPDGNYISYELFDSLGNNIWSVSADGALTKRLFDTLTVARTGQVTEIVRNAANAPSSYHGLTLNPSGRNGSGGSLTTKFYRDLLGRVQEEVAPGGVGTYSRREMRSFPQRVGLSYFAEVKLPFALPEGGHNGPATITWYNADDDVIGASDYTVGSYTNWNQSGYYAKFSNYTIPEEIARSEVVHDVSGLVTSQTVRHDVDGQPAGVPLSSTTMYTYDSLGRVLTSTNPVLTITRNTYDVLDRVIKVEVGTDLVTPPMVPVSEYVYDAALASPDVQGAGNGNLTRLKQHVDGTSESERPTDYKYDFRDRLVLVQNPDKPYFEATAYDNLDRPVRRAMYAPSSPTPLPPETNEDYTTSYPNRVRFARTDYSQRGLVWRQALAINPGIPDPLTFLETQSWYDEVGRTVQSWGPNGPATKTTFDGLGRPQTVFATDRRGDTTYAHVYNATDHKADVTGDVVFEQTTYQYILESAAAHDGQLELVIARRRTHDAADSEAGDLATGGLPAERVITTYAGTDYDGADRVSRSINFGTNHISNEFKFNGPLPLKDGNGNWITGALDLITQTSYNPRGLVDTVTSPALQKTKYLYDDSSRRIAVVENQVNVTMTSLGWSNSRWTVSGLTSDDQDRVTSFVYDGNGNVIKQVAHLPGGGGETVQVTDYNYGTNLGAPPGLVSDISSKDLLGSVIYPETTSVPLAEDRTVWYAYNRQGEVTLMEDQNNTRHAYSRDKLGRVTLDSVPQVLSPIDTAVKAIRTQYDDAGRVKYVSSYNTPTPGPTPVNEVGFGYNPLWQIANVDQDHNGVVEFPSGDTRRVAYTYASSAASGGWNSNYSRLSRITYPDNSQLDVEYSLQGDPTNSSNSVISRVVRLILGGLEVVNWDHVGLDLFVLVDYPVPDVQLDRTAGHDGERQTFEYTSNAGVYPGLDRFGRVARQMWVDGSFTTHAPYSTNYGNRPPIVELTYSYDKDSNRLTALDERPGSLWPMSQEYDYDGLDRLTEAKRGLRSGATVPAGLNTQQWDLDMLGNWTVLNTELNGSAGYIGNEVETRTHNGVNELVTRDPDGAGGSAPVNLTYDYAGNLRERYTSSTARWDYTHDAWNRLVRVKVGTATPLPTREEYEYNGLNWRTVRRVDRPNGLFALDQQRLMYYGANWQLLEERIDDDTPLGSDFDRYLQYVWGQRYIDDIVLHRKDAGANGMYEDVWYHLTDVQFSNVAILDDAGAVLKERVTYNAYGQARHHYPGDFNGDGQASQAEKDSIQQPPLANSTIDDPDYRSEVDFTRDGLINILDYLQTQVYSARAAGQITDPAIDNQIGYDGYVFNSETQQYCVRYRTYDPMLGRWLERDPAGYWDSSNLYDYALGRPVSATDPMGLWGVAGHFWTVYIIARCSGAGNTDAYELAYYAQYLDQEKGRDAATIGIKEKTPYSEAAVLEKQIFELLHQLYGRITPDCGAFRECLGKLIKDGKITAKQAGILLHALGDSYAHTRTDANGNCGVYSWPYGHARDGHDPDNIGKRPDVYRSYVEDALSVMFARLNNGQAVSQAAKDCVEKALFPPGGLPINELLARDHLRYQANRMQRDATNGRWGLQFKYRPTDEFNLDPSMAKVSDSELREIIKMMAKECECLHKNR